MSTSTNGGLSWGAALTSADSARGLGGQPVVQPNGTLIVPYASSSFGSIRSFRSVDGGTNWRVSVTVAGVLDHLVAGGLRSEPLPTAEMDASGKVYVVWQDCRYRTSCRSNGLCQLDVGYVFSHNRGSTWSAPAQLTGPMALSWLAATNQGRMVGDYISSSFVNGGVRPVFAAASTPFGGLFNEAMFTTAALLP